MSSFALFTVATAISIAMAVLVLASQIFRGPRRLLLQGIGLFVGVPAFTAMLVLVPLAFDFSFSDGLSIAGLILTLVLSGGAGVGSRLAMRLRIGIVIPSGVPFHLELRAGMSEGLAGLHAEVYDDYLTATRAVEKLADFTPSLRRTLRWRPDYLVVCSPSVDLISSQQVVSLLRSHTRLGGAIVFIDNCPFPAERERLGKRTGSVTSDVSTGARMIAEYLRSKLNPGESVLIVAGPSSSAPAVLRRQTFEAALPDAVVEVADVGVWTTEACYEVVKRQLRAGFRPRYVISGNDVMAFGAVNAIREFQAADERGFECGVIGYDGIARALFAIAEPTNPLSATIMTPPSAYGNEIVAMIEGRWRWLLSESTLHDVVIPVGEGQLITSNNVELVLDG